MEKYGGFAFWIYAYFFPSPMARNDLGMFFFGVDIIAFLLEFSLVLFFPPFYFLPAIHATGLSAVFRSCREYGGVFFL